MVKKGRRKIVPRGAKRAPNEHKKSIKIVKNAEKSEFQMLRGEGMGWFQGLMFFSKSRIGLLTMFYCHEIHLNAIYMPVEPSKTI